MLGEVGIYRGEPDRPSTSLLRLRGEEPLNEVMLRRVRGFRTSDEDV